MMCRGVYQLTRGSSAERGRDVGQLLANRLAALGIDTDRLRFRRFSERGLSLHQPTGFDRALLVGEAAGIDPVLGEGIAQAILYGQVAGPFLARAAEQGDWTMRDFGKTLRRSRVGLDLRIRAAATPLVYGRLRPSVERWVARSTALARAGMAYFAGRRVPRLALLRAAVDILAPRSSTGR
jgi:flavin-dependent dehydrogenase